MNTITHRPGLDIPAQDSRASRVGAGDSIDFGGESWDEHEWSLTGTQTVGICLAIVLLSAAVAAFH